MTTRKAIASLLTCFTCLFLHAQTGPFAQACFGYGLPVICRELNSNYEADSSGNFHDEGVYGSYGAGISAGIGLGFDFCENGGGQLGFSWLNGKKYEYTDVEQIFGDFSGTYTEQARGFYLEPQARLFTAHDDHPITWFLRAGLLLPVGVKLIRDIHETSEDLFSTTVTDGTLEGKSSMNIGFSGAGGGIFHVNDRIGIFAEANVRAISLSWSTAEYTEFTSTYNSNFGGDPVITSLADLDVADKQFEFVKVITDADNQDENQPTKQLKDYYPFSSAGINVGIEFRF